MSRDIDKQIKFFLRLSQKEDVKICAYGETCNKARKRTRTNIKVLRKDPGAFLSWTDLQLYDNDGVSVKLRVKYDPAG